MTSESRVAQGSPPDATHAWSPCRVCGAAVDDPEATEPCGLRDPEPIANETESSLARRRELVAEARAADGLRVALERIAAALHSEDELRHAEAVKETPNRDGYIGLGRCSYCEDAWPCRTERLSAPLRELIHDTLAPSPEPDQETAP